MAVEAGSAELDAEALLAVTGLLEPPGAGHLALARDLVRDTERALVAALGAEKLQPLRPVRIGKTYFKRLQAPPPYEAWMEWLEGRRDVTFAAAYIAKHTSARDMLIARRPSNSVTGVLGEEVAPPDPEMLVQWEMEADVVETQRVIYDLASAAVLPETLAVFDAAFPALSAHLATFLDEERAKRKERKWAPPPWMDASLRLWLRLPPDPAPSPVAPAPAPKPAVTKLDTAALETATTTQPK
jgi:hypothetical protein